ncbi:HAD-IIB family hydrolase [Piscinibacter sakaiensis]|uniref:HAD-IIB family hydrolase n=1 Tax=Piscinibacter sakaiensis TaxID=1547922 RepID=UPI003AAD2214
MPVSPLPLADCTDDELRHLRGILTDIDDTLTSDGAIAPEALAALQRLAAAGIPVIAITGRPMGWSQPFAREWPIAAIVAENGAVALFRDEADGVRIDYAQDEATRVANAKRLAQVARQIVESVPGATLARDSAGRVTDIAIDHSEFEHLDETAIARVVALMRAAGMNATVSSIHINGWYGSHDKLSGARWMLRELFGLEGDDELQRWAYVGDSTNDQQMFERIPLSVGVANLLRFADQLTVWPRYLTRGERGAGFAELADRVLACRGAA